MISIFYKGVGWTVGIVFLSLISFVASVNAQTACHTYQSGQAAVNGYGVPWNVLTSAKELLLTATCNGTTVALTAGTGNTSHYVYHQGYTYGTSWNPFTFSGTYVENNNIWLSGQGTFTVQGAPEGNTFWVAYICMWNGKWNCGCATSACTDSRWQLQTFSIPVSSGTTGGGTTGGGTAGSSGGGFYDYDGRDMTASTNEPVGTYASGGMIHQRYNAANSETPITSEQAAAVAGQALSTYFPGPTLTVSGSGRDLYVRFIHNSAAQSVRVVLAGELNVMWPTAYSGSAMATAILEAFALEHFRFSTTPMQTDLY